MNNQTEKQFALMVSGLLQTEFCPDWDPKLLHGFMGIASETGELLSRYQDSIEQSKKFSAGTSFILGCPLDRTTTLIELSDLLHYMQMIIGVQGSSISEVKLIEVVEIDSLRLENRFRDEITLDVSTTLNPILLRSFMRLASEGGELLNRYKKFLFYHGEPFTRDEILVKLSVLLRHIQMILDVLDSSIEETICINIAKLHSRYPEGYSHDKAITHLRDKKAEKAAVDAVITVFAALRLKYLDNTTREKIKDSLRKEEV